MPAGSNKLFLGIGPMGSIVVNVSVRRMLRAAMGAAIGSKMLITV